jgi:inner membrane protein COX18
MSSPITLVESYFEMIHTHLPLLSEPLPWWLSVVVGTVIMRTMITVPVALYQRKRVKRFVEVQPLVKAWETTLQLQQKQQNATVTDTQFKKLVRDFSIQ